MPFSCNFFRCDFSSRAAASARFHRPRFHYPLLNLTKAFLAPILQEIPIVSGGFFRTLCRKHRAKQEEARLHEACHREKFLSTAAKQHASGARLSGFIIPAGRMRRLARPFFRLNSLRICKRAAADSRPLFSVQTSAENCPEG